MISISRITDVPLVSIIMAVHGEGFWLGNAIDSAVAQSVREWELICVLDQTTPAVDRILEHRMQDPRIRSFTLDEGCGATAARNLGLANAVGEFVAILDSDDVWTVDHLEVALTFLNDKPQVALVGTDYQPVDSSGVPFGKSVRLPKKHIKFHLLLRNAFCHSSVVFRRMSARSVGAYPNEVTIGEDYCLWLRLAGIADVENLNMTTVMYRLHGGQLSRRSVDHESARLILESKLVLGRKQGVPKSFVKFAHFLWMKHQF